MKKLVFFLGLLPLLAITSFAQESRQDVSMSFVGTFQPNVTGNAVTQSSTIGIGDLVSYRFMLNPSNALEANYQYSQFSQRYVSTFSNGRVHTRFQEGSIAFVHSFVYKNFNPFVEGGGGMYLYGVIDDTGTSTAAAKKGTSYGGLFGGGIAYELSPSWDLRVQYRGIITKDNHFGLSIYNTNRYYITSQPAIGFAYHF
ncbi:MAG TPA: outer membrane beta-barrel protein [Acidobacteriaceae bacterium]|jgi:opacity protein-like surface antigen|nr:outer membrane beta-barrel protein [Acidobacteriaceae bacterium]